MAEYERGCAMKACAGKAQELAGEGSHVMLWWRETLKLAIRTNEWRRQRRWHRKRKRLTDNESNEDHPGEGCWVLGGVQLHGVLKRE